MMRFVLIVLMVGCSVVVYGQNVGIGISSPQSKLHVKPNNAGALQTDPLSRIYRIYRIIDCVEFIDA
jgi:hypothetical protein